MIELAKLKERVQQNNAGMDIRREYDAILQDLKARYTEEEIEKTWRDWSKVRGKFEYHQRKAANIIKSRNQSISELKKHLILHLYFLILNGIFCN